MDAPEETVFLKQGGWAEYRGAIAYLLTLANRALFDNYYGETIMTRVLPIDRNHFPILGDAEEVWLVFDQNKIKPGVDLDDQLRNAPPYGDPAYDEQEKEDSYSG
jgi:hypothetical protein